MKNLINMIILINADIIDRQTGEIYANMKFDFYARDMEYGADIIKMIENNYTFSSQEVDGNQLLLYYIKWVN